MTVSADALPLTLQAGQILNVDASGELIPLAAAAATTPPYVSMFEGTVQAGAPDNDSLVGGRQIAVSRVQTEPVEYETRLETEIADIAAGQLYGVNEEGTSLDTAAGTFEVTSFDGTGAVGDKVRGKFTALAKTI
jgi:hypothetical protein